MATSDISTLRQQLAAACSGVLMSRPGRCGGELTVGNSRLVLPVVLGLIEADQRRGIPAADLATHLVDALPTMPRGHATAIVSLLADQWPLCQQYLAAWRAEGDQIAATALGIASL